MKYFILCIITVVGINVFSQTLKLKVQDKSIELKSSSSNLPVDNIVELIKDKNQNDILIYSNYLGLKDINEGQYKGQKTGDFREGIVFNDGSKFEFSEKETYLCNIGNNIFSKKIDFLKSLTKINLYQINTNGLNKLPISISIPLNNAFNKIPNCEFFINSNLDETAGDEVKIYDKHLNITSTYIPYEEGFSNLLYNSLGEYIYIVSTPSIYTKANKEYKVTSININSSFAITEYNFAGEIIPQRLISLENKLALINVDKILLISKQGNIIWSKDMNVSSKEFATIGDESEGRLFVISEGAIVCLNILDGSEMWRKSLKDIYPNFEMPKSIKNESYKSFVVIDLKLITTLKLIGVLTAKKEQNISDNLMNFSNKNLTLIGYDGEIIRQIHLSSANNSSINTINYTQGQVKASQLLIEDFGFRVINDRKIEKYEK